MSKPTHHPEVDLNQVDWDKLADVRRAADGEFELLKVNEKTKLKTFIESVGSLKYSFNDEDSGNSYYEWTAGVKELKQNVDIVVMDVERGCFYVGNGIRRLLSLPDRGGAYYQQENRQDVLNFAPINVKGRDKFPIFISSTSVHRAVKVGDRVLYRRVALRF